MNPDLTRRRFMTTLGSAGAMAAATVTCTVPRSLAAVSLTADPRSLTPKRWIIDSHVHLKHGDAAKTEWSPEAVVDLMVKAGIDKAVVFAMSTTTQRSIEMAQDAVKKYPDRLIPYLYALPNYERPVIRDIEAALAGGVFRGIKIHAGECTLAPYIIDPVIKLAGKFAVPCLVDVVGNAAVATRLAKEFPDTTLIYAHMGRYLAKDAALVDAFIRVAEQFDNVLLDLSAVALVEKIEQAVRRIGSLKLVWGTDGPYANPDIVTYARTELDKMRNLQVSEADKENILGRAIAKVLKLA